MEILSNTLLFITSLIVLLSMVTILLLVKLVFFPTPLEKLEKQERELQEAREALEELKLIVIPPLLKPVEWLAKKLQGPSKPL